MMLAVAVFAGVGAAMSFRRAADPMGFLKRLEKRHGYKYAGLVSDPQKFSARQSTISTLSGVFLCLTSLVLLILAVTCFSTASSPRQPSAREILQRESFDAYQRSMRRNDEEMRNWTWARTTAPSSRPGEGAAER
jgi:hypothetical protein